MQPLLALFLCSAGNAATEAALRSALSEFNDHAQFGLPELSEQQLEQLVNGKLLRIREVDPDPDLPQRAIGLQIVAHSKNALWIAARDPHFQEPFESLTEVALTPTDGEMISWYQHLDVSWPFRDRHWVVDIRDNHELATSTNDRCWEHYWHLTEGGPALAAQAIASGIIPGITSEIGDASIYTPVNTGAYLAIALGEETLWGFHATSVVGGSIPDDFVAKYSMMRLKKVMGRVTDRGDEARAHYQRDHAPVLGGGGKLIELFNDP